MMTIRENIDLMRRLSEKMPKTIHEAMEFDEEEFDEDLKDKIVADEDIPTEEGPVDFSEYESDESPVAEAPVEEPDVKEVPEKACDTSAAKTLINSMRKQALQAMAELSDCPECTEYQTLKKVFTLLEKKPETMKDED